MSYLLLSFVVLGSATVPLTTAIEVTKEIKIKKKCSVEYAAYGDHLDRQFLVFIIFIFMSPFAILIINWLDAIISFKAE